MVNWEDWKQLKCPLITSWSDKLGLTNTRHSVRPLKPRGRSLCLVGRGCPQIRTRSQCRRTSTKWPRPGSAPHDSGERLPPPFPHLKRGDGKNSYLAGLLWGVSVRRSIVVPILQDCYENKLTYVKYGEEAHLLSARSWWAVVITTAVCAQAAWACPKVPYGPSWVHEIEKVESSKFVTGKAI